MASLHQGIADLLPTRLEFYESWLNPSGLRDGRIGLAPLAAVLSFLRQEGEPYRLIVGRAGEYTAEWTVADMPGYKFPGLFAFYAVPVPGHTPDEMRDAIHKEIDKLKTSDVSDDELEMFKTRARAGLLRGLADNSGLAHQLAEYQTRFGDWRELFRELDRINKVSKADVRRVANKVFVDSNRTSTRIEFKPPTQPAAAAQGGAQ